MTTSISITGSPTHGLLDLSELGGDHLLTTSEYARVRRTSPAQVAKERHYGTGCKFVKIGGRCFYRVSDVKAFFESNLRTSTGNLCDQASQVAE